MCEVDLVTLTSDDLDKRFARVTTQVLQKTQQILAFSSVLTFFSPYFRGILDLCLFKRWSSSRFFFVIEIHDRKHEFPVQLSQLHLNEFVG